MFTVFRLLRWCNFATSQDITILSLPHQMKVGPRLEFYTRPEIVQSWIHFMMAIFQKDFVSPLIGLNGTIEI